MLEHPLRAAALMFLGFGVLTAPCVLLYPNVAPARVILTTLSLILVLSVFPIGLVLAPERVRLLWAFSMLGLVLITAVGFAWFFSDLAKPETFDRAFLVLDAMRGVVWMCGAACALLAGYSWLLYFRGQG